MDITLDHAVISVTVGLDEAAETYRRLGFRLTERGHHTLGSSNHLAIFRTNYLELLGFEAGKPRRTDFVSETAGLDGLALKTRDGEGLYRELAARGLPVEPPAHFSRPVALADGSFDARFTVVRLTPGALPSGRLFFCQHLTPALVWRPEWQEHANGVIDIAYVVACATDPARWAEIFRRLAPESWREMRDGIAIDLGPVRLDVLTPEAVRQRFEGAASEDGEDGGRMVALGLRTRSLDAAAQALAAGGIQADGSPGGLLVPAADALGVALEFVA